MSTRRATSLSLAEWAAGFAALSFGVLGALSIGVFVLPVAAALLILSWYRNAGWPLAAFGALVGTGLTSLYVAAVNRAFVPCPPQQSVVRLSPGETFSCGGTSPTPWFLVGVGTVTLGVVGYRAWQRRRRISSLNGRGDR
jgi:hypothetical protein